jgi:hypothetical protein
VGDVHRRTDRVQRERSRSDEGERDEFAARDPLGAKLRTATVRKRNPMIPTLVLVPVAGEKMSLIASAPPPVRS